MVGAGGWNANPVTEAESVSFLFLLKSPEQGMLPKIKKNASSYDKRIIYKEVITNMHSINALKVETGHRKL